MMLVLAATIGSIGCSDKIDHDKFAALNQSAHAALENANVGSALVTFSDVVGAYATETALAFERAQSLDEKRFVKLHIDALQAYRDSLTIWTEKIEQHRAGLSTGFNPELRRIANAYEAPGKLLGLAADVSADEVIQKIWSVGRIKLEAADAMYRGDPVPVPGAP